MNADDPVNWLARAFDDRRKHLQRQMNEMLGHDVTPEAADYILKTIRERLRANEEMHALLMRLLFEDAERKGKADGK